VSGTNDWERPEDFESFLARKGSGWIFKHSTRCPISAEAARQFTKYQKAHPQAAVHRVLVIENRPLSEAIAERLGVLHQSPQAILIQDGAPAWSASHWDITAEALEEAWEA